MRDVRTSVTLGESRDASCEIARMICHVFGPLRGSVERSFCRVLATVSDRVLL
jgi:hypothetical protein